MYDVPVAIITGIAMIIWLVVAVILYVLKEDEN